jgi:hypothetical protein
MMSLGLTRCEEKFPAWPIIGILFSYHILTERGSKQSLKMQKFFYYIGLAI